MFSLMHSLSLSLLNSVPIPISTQVAVFFVCDNEIKECGRKITPDPNMPHFWKSMCNFKQTVLCNVLPCGIVFLCLNRHSWPVVTRRNMNCFWRYEQANCCDVELGRSWRAWEGEREVKRWSSVVMRNVLSGQTGDICPNTERGEVKSLCVHRGLWPCSQCHRPSSSEPLSRERRERSCWSRNRVILSERDLVSLSH